MPLPAASGVGPVGDDGLLPRTWVAVTPGDATDISLVATKGFYVSVAGNVTLRAVDSTADVVFAVVAGQYIFGSFKFAKAATTATLFALGG